MVLVTVGTGIGGGVVVDSRLLRGAYGIAGELGHMRVVPDGIRCGCGNRAAGRCTPRATPGPRGARAGRLGSPERRGPLGACGGDPAKLHGGTTSPRWPQAGDPAAVELLADLGRWLGEGLASVAAVLDPELIVIGGGVIAAGELLLGPARAAYARQLTGRGHRPVAEIVPAALGNDAGHDRRRSLAAEGVGR